MSIRVEAEDIQTTKSEKLLAAVLVAFLLIGGIWTYVKIDDAVRTTSPPDYSYRGTPAEQSAIQRRDRAQRRLDEARVAVASAERRLVERREAFRTALEAGRPATGLGRAYDRAQAELGQARREGAAAAAVRNASPAAEGAESHVASVQAGRENRRELLAFLLRLVFVLTSVGFGYWLLSRLRRRQSRYFPVAMAFVAYAAILASIMATDYLTDYLDPLDLGPLVLSLVGVALTMVAFVALQRYLARRIPARRVRKSECPYCGYPVRENSHCEGCGREVIGECARCKAQRRVGTLHCSACGAV